MNLKNEFCLYRNGGSINIKSKKLKSVVTYYINFLKIWYGIDHME